MSAHIAACIVSWLALSPPLGEEEADAVARALVANVERRPAPETGEQVIQQVMRECF